ncbi:Protein translocase subunit SecY [Candidatus Bilamarchaeum dharawalense]|uniref:Protein translocase subunit SecY n=1 Tax=Candidatus Bilamarchaeum dharawalense TaxID=2885759 RepID=A0A5E4LS23_9ARCH|nr:Protein translocase subunit SecY [Candidatus Bilamarchaeum dharawalense]
MGLLDILHTIAGYLPEIKAPIKALATKERLIWTGVALILYFMMYETTALGVQYKDTSAIDFLQTITASRTGSLLTTGIGPIVLASIFLQLFVGAGIININMHDKKERARFLEAQKILAIVLAIVEALIFVVFTGIVPVSPLFAGLGEGIITDPVTGVQHLYAPFTMAMVVFQIAIGSVLILFLDELVTKYGIGSGISLFIAAGVSLSVAVGLVHLIFATPNGFIAMMSEGGAEALPNALLTIVPFLFTILVFLVVVYAESLKVEIPIAFERVRGMVPNLPLKFFYVSNIPVIFASALIINMQLFAGGLLTGAYWETSQVTGAVTSVPAYQALLETRQYDFARDGVLPLIGYTTQDNRLRDGLLYLFTPLYGMGQGTQYYSLLFTTSTPILGIPEWVHAIVYILMLSIVSVIFGLFWVETSNMDAKSVANQLSESGLQIPGFRRDPRMLETILNKHIFPLTVMGSFCVGLLAGIADLTGALGTGTGILLTVGILHKMYEQLEQMKTFEMYPSFTKFLE